MFRLLKMGLRNLGRNRWQALLSIIGITLAVAFTIGITTVVTAVNDDFIMERRGNSYVDITVHGVEGSWISFEEVKARLSTESNIARLSPAIILTVDLSQFGVEGAVTIYGLDPQSHPDWDLLPIISGDKSIAGDNVVLSASLAAQADVSAGETISILDSSFTVSGIFDDQDLGKFAHLQSSTLIIVDVNFIRSFLGRTGDEITTVLVSVSNFLDVELVYRKIINTLGDNYNVVLEQTVSSFDRLIINAYGTTMTVVILITLFVEFIFLSNLFLIIVNEQQPNIGLMRALGMTRWQVAFLFMLEISFYGIIGSVLGLYIGHAFSSALMSALLTSQGLPVENIPGISPFDVLFAFESGLFIALLAGLYPTVVILRYAISRALYERRHLLTQTDKDIPIRRLFFIFGTAFLALGIFLTIQASREKSIEIRLDSAFALSILLIFLGVFLIQLLSLWFVPQLIQRVGATFSKLLIPISTRNIARYRIRSIASVATNAIALTFALTVVIMTATLAYHVPTWYQDAFPSTDLIVEIKDDQLLPEANVTMFLAESSVIEDLTYVKLAFGRYLGSAEEIVDVFGVQSQKFSKFASKTLRQENIRALGELAAPDTIRVIVTTTFAQAHALSLNDTFQMTLIFTNETVPIINARVYGIVADNVFSLSSNSLQIYADENVLEQAFNITIGVKYVLLDLFNSSQSSTVIDTLKSNHPEIRQIYSTQDQLNKLNSAIKRQETFLRALTYQSIIIAALTQFVAILLSAERSRYEIGIIRANGLGRFRVLTLFILEGMILGVVGLLLGWIDSFIASTLLQTYIERIAGEMTLIIPIDELVLWSLFFLVVVLAATLYPGWRTATLPVIRSLDVRSQLFGTTVSIRELIKTTLVRVSTEYRKRLASSAAKKLILVMVVYFVLGYFFIRTLQLTLSVIFFAYMFYRFLRDDLHDLDAIAVPVPAVPERQASDGAVALSTSSSVVPLAGVSTSERVLSSQDRENRLQGGQHSLIGFFSKTTFGNIMSMFIFGLFIFISFRMVDIFARNLLFVIFQGFQNPDTIGISVAWLIVLPFLILFFMALLVLLFEYPLFRFAAFMLSEWSFSPFKQRDPDKIREILERNDLFRNSYVKKSMRDVILVVESRYIIMFLLVVFTLFSDLPIPSMEVLSLILDIMLGLILCSLLSRHFVHLLSTHYFPEVSSSSESELLSEHLIRKQVKDLTDSRLEQQPFFKSM